MTANLFRPGNFTPLPVAAARGMMNDAIAPQALGVQYAQYVENMVPAKSKMLSKRFGLTDLNTTGIQDSESIKWIDSFIHSDGSFSMLCATDAGKIYVSDSPITTWTEAFSGLDAAGKVRSVTMDSKLVIVNGIDTPMYYDGSTVQIIKEWVDDNGASKTKVDSDTFTIIPLTGRDASDYPAGRNLRITMNDGVHTSTVLSTSYNTGTGVLTVNLSTNVLSGTTISRIQYEDSPPAFSAIYQMHDRLWALGPGELKAESYRDSDDRMYVYYTDGTNSVTSWFTQSGTGAQNIPYINLALKHEVSDELVGISTTDAYTVFFGRKRTQIWSGTQPHGSSVDFSWLKTVAIGAISGDMIQKYADDLVFMTVNGLRNLKTVAVTQNIKTSQEIGENIENTAIEELKDATTDDDMYKGLRSFTYAHGGFYGFSFGNKSLVYFVKNADSGWAVFTGLFGKAEAIHDAPDGKLYMAYENSLYVYGDREGIFDDAGDSIQTVWWTPWLQARNVRWANNHVELEMNPGAVMDVVIRRYKNNDASNYKETILNTKAGSSYWDNDFWDVALWDYVAENKFSRGTDKFVAYNMSAAIMTNTATGPFDIVKLTFFGIMER